MDSLENFLLDQVKGNRTPSIQYILFDKERVIKRYSSGLRDIKEGKVVDSHTTYNAFSVTKTFTALAILQLAERGKLDLEAPARQYLPGFPYPADITVKNLLTHTAGIPNPIPLSWIHLASEHGSFNSRDFFGRLMARYNKVRSKPNTKFAYSNPGYILLGQIIEELSRIPFEQYITENIIDKLGIGPNELGFTIREFSDHAKGYIRKASFTNLVLGLFLNKSKFMAPAEGIWKPFRYYYINGAPYGGLIGRPDAFVIYLQELLKSDGRLLSNEYKNLLFTENHTNDARATGMCLSWFTGRLNGHQYFSHAGGGGGYYDEIRIYPEAGIGSVLFFNRTGMKDERFLDKLDKFYWEAVDSK